MAVTVQKITLWRGEVENRPGALAGILAPLADTGADLQVLMGYPARATPSSRHIPSPAETATDADQVVTLHQKGRPRAPLTEDRARGASRPGRTGCAP